MDQNALTYQKAVTSLKHSFQEMGQVVKRDEEVLSAARTRVTTLEAEGYTSASGELIDALADFREAEGNLQLAQDTLAKQLTRLAPRLNSQDLRELCRVYFSFANPGMSAQDQDVAIDAILSAHCASLA